MKFSKIDKSKLTSLEKKALAKIKGGDDPIQPCYNGCQHCAGVLNAMNKAQTAENIYY